MCNKSRLRKKHKYLRNQMSLMDVIAYSESISNTVIESKAFESAKVVFAYMATMNEVHVRFIIEEALQQGKKVALPKVVDKVMVYHLVDSLDQVTLGAYNIMEPTSDCEVEPNEGDLMLVPGIVFDQKGYRIGYGGGYYDRYMSRFAAVDYNRLGVCYANQLVEAIDVEAFDQKVDRVVCESL